MPEVTIDLATGFYQSDSLPLANQRCVNLYPNVPQTTALTQSALFSVQGIEEVLSSGTRAAESNRGGWVFNGVPYVVNGGALYQIRRQIALAGVINYSLLRLGSIGGEGLCSFADNGRQMIIINSGVGYIYEPTASPQFSVISDAGFYANGTPEQVVFLDSYFVVTTDQKKAIVSAVNDGTDWNALDSFTAEADPDAIVAPFVFRNQLYLLGTQTTETYQNIGGTGTPFQRINGFVLAQGCSAPFSVINSGDNVLWVGAGENQEAGVWAFQGSSTAVKVSTRAVDTKFQELTPESLANVFSWAYSVRGQQFVAFTSSEFTLVYDLATGLWHERESSITNASGIRNQTRCRIVCVLSAYNELLVGDSEDGRIGRLVDRAEREYDNPMFCYFTTSPMYQLGNSFGLTSIELECETGVGNKEFPDPEVRLEISRDGFLFGYPRTRYLGKRGDYKNRVIWTKNGLVRKMAIFKVTVSDAVERRFYQLIVRYRQGIGNGR